MKSINILAATGIVMAAVAGTALTPGNAFGQTKSSASTKDIVEIAVENGSFKTLVTALKAANLVMTLKGDGPFTVFAPTDAAFAQLPPGTLNALLQDKKKLAAILSYHVVAGKVMSTDIPSAGVKPATVNGKTLSVKPHGGKVHINGASVTTADIVASNGVIHVIDKVLIPDAK